MIRRKHVGRKNHSFMPRNGCRNLLSHWICSTFIHSFRYNKDSQSNQINPTSQQINQNLSYWHSSSNLNNGTKKIITKQRNVIANPSLSSHEIIIFCWAYLHHISHAQWLALMHCVQVSFIISFLTTKDTFRDHIRSKNNLQSSVYLGRMETLLNKQMHGDEE